MDKRKGASWLIVWRSKNHLSFIIWHLSEFISCHLGIRTASGNDRMLHTPSLKEFWDSTCGAGGSIKPGMRRGEERICHLAYLAFDICQFSFGYSQQLLITPNDKLTNVQCQMTDDFSFHRARGVPSCRSCHRWKIARLTTAPASARNMSHCVSQTSPCVPRKAVPSPGVAQTAIHHSISS